MAKMIKSRRMRLMRRAECMEEVRNETRILGRKSQETLSHDA
jgi:hypothetical protein